MSAALDLDAELAAWEAEQAAKEAAIARVVAAGERGVIIPGRWGLDLFVHRDTYPGRVGQWRVTRFEAGEPVGHTDAASFEAAVRTCRDFGGDYNRATWPTTGPEAPQTT